MSKCPKCGLEIKEDAKFCPDCGENQSAGQTKSASDTASDIGDTLKKLNDTEDSTSEFDAADIESNKIFCILAYLSMLVIIPLIGSQNSKFTRFHANQGLVLVICELVWGIVSAIVIGIINALFGIIHLGFIADIISSLLRLVNLAFLILSIIGIVNVMNGKAKQLPFIGNIKLIK
jgi:uncharacterized membrane protein